MYWLELVYIGQNRPVLGILGLKHICIGTYGKVAGWKCIDLSKWGRLTLMKGSLCNVLRYFLSFCYLQVWHIILRKFFVIFFGEALERNLSFIFLGGTKCVFLFIMGFGGSQFKSIQQRFFGEIVVALS